MAVIRCAEETVTTVLQVTNTGCLMVCLCDLDGIKCGVDGMPFAELCEHHNAVKLESIANDVRCLLHVLNEIGDVVPVVKKA